MLGASIMTWTVQVSQMLQRLAYSKNRPGGNGCKAEPVMDSFSSMLRSAASSSNGLRTWSSWPTCSHNRHSHSWQTLSCCNAWCIHSMSNNPAKCTVRTIICRITRLPGPIAQAVLYVPAQLLSKHVVAQVPGQALQGNGLCHGDLADPPP